MDGRDIITIRMPEEEVGLVRKFAAIEGMGPEDFARAAILEKVEDASDLQLLHRAIAEDNGERFSIDEIIEEL